MRSLILYLVFISFIHLIHVIYAGRNGLTIKLIHRDSVESPLYPGNLSHEEKLKRIHNQSDSHVKRVLSLMEERNMTITNHLDEVRVSTYFEGFFYLVLVGIGTFNQNPSCKIYYLMVDTGSDVIWTQCEGYDPCYTQNKPLYPYPRSSTFRQIPCHEHGYCGEPSHCLNNICTYEAEYFYKAKTRGFLALEKFTFKSDGQASEIVDNLIIGCGTKQTNFDFGHEDPSQNSIAGILGMGNSPGISFIGQLGSRAQNKFSHCLQPWKNGRVSTTFLRFGDDAYFRSAERVLHTGLYQNRNKRFPYYYVKLLDITIAETRLNFPADSFSFRADGTGGCIVDNGAPSTVMSEQQYARLTPVLSKFFRGLRQRRFRGYKHCYTKSNVTQDMPRMIFHFLGANYEVAPENLFMDFEDKFCLAIQTVESYKIPMIIGNHMLTNYRFIYDLTSMRLSFAREDCNTNQ